MISKLYEYAATAFTVLLLAALALLVLAIPFELLDASLGHDSPAFPAIIKAKSYTPSSTSTGVGTAISSSGNPGVVVVSSHEGEKWTLIVEVEGQVCAVPANGLYWASVKEGDSILLSRRIGKFTSSKYDWRIAQ